MIQNSSNIERLGPAVDNGTAVAAKTFAVGTTAVLVATANTFPLKSVLFVLVEVQADKVRVRFDGTSPTSSVGHELAAGYREVWSVARWNSARFIRSGAADATVFASPLHF
jgi:hypothetical protein